MFNKEDLAKYLGLKKIIGEGFFEIKGEAAIAVASHIIWFNELENKIRQDITRPEIKPVALSKPIKKD
jgi:hypothetical protein